MYSQKSVTLLMGFLFVSALTGTGQATGSGHSFSKREVAIANIYDCRGGGLLGRAVLTEQPSKQGVKTVKVSIKVKGLSRGEHAVHIHETGACEPCGAAGGHFDPGPNSNPSPDGNHPFHSGDLINIKAKRNSWGTLHTVTTRVTLSPGPSVCLTRTAALSLSMTTATLTARKAKRRDAPAVVVRRVGSLNRCSCYPEKGRA